MFWVNKLFVNKIYDNTAVLLEQSIQAVEEDAGRFVLPLT
jgi:hypothetical protein